MSDSNSSKDYDATKTGGLRQITLANEADGSNSSRDMGSSSADRKMRLPSILDNKWFVLAAIFGAMMFLGLPLIWRCPAFSRIEKIIWTILTLIYSYAIIWMFLWVMSWSWRQIQNSLY